MCTFKNFHSSNLLESTLKRMEMRHLLRTAEQVPTIGSDNPPTNPHFKANSMVAMHSDNNGDYTRVTPQATARKHIQKHVTTSFLGYWGHSLIACAIMIGALVSVITILALYQHHPLCCNPLHWFRGRWYLICRSSTSKMALFPKASSAFRLHFVRQGQSRRDNRRFAVAMGTGCKV